MGTTFIASEGGESRSRGGRSARRVGGEVVARNVLCHARGGLEACACVWWRRGGSAPSLEQGGS